MDRNNLRNTLEDVATTTYYKHNNIKIESPALLQEEFNYIWQILKKYDLDKAIKHESQINQIKFAINTFGFVQVQQVLRELRWLKMPRRAYFTTILLEKLNSSYEKDVNIDKLMKIKAYKNAEQEQLNKKYLDELHKNEISKLEKTQGVKKFVNFKGRNRNEGNKNGYMSFEEIERKLLGWDK